MKDLKVEHTRIYNLILKRKQDREREVFSRENIFDSFKWVSSPEGFVFWHNLYMHSLRDEEYLLFYERYPTPRKWYIKINMQNSEEINSYAGRINGYIPSGSGFVVCNLTILDSNLVLLDTPNYVTYHYNDLEEIGMYEFRKIIKQLNQTKNNTIMWKKINRNNLPSGVVVSRRGAVVHSGFLTTHAGMVLLVSSSPSKNREALIEWPEGYMKTSDLLELPYETSAKDILMKEIKNSASEFTGIIIHPKLADRLVEEGVVFPSTSAAGYRFRFRPEISDSVPVYVSSDNMKPEQVIVF